MQWLNKVIDEIIDKQPDGEILIESGGSPSGTHHLGHLRELITADAILLELKRRSRNARHIYFVDDLDGLRKIPVDVPEEFNKYLGRPLCDIPAPSEDDKSYADYFLQGLVDASSVLGMKIEFVKSHLRYREGFFVPAIERSLERLDQTRSILESISGHKLGPEWSPIQINEDGYLKKRPFTGIDKNSKTLKYLDKDGVERSTSYEHGEVKLDWRLDWPARWWLLKVQVEPFGRDHATKGGSYDTGEALMREVYEAPAPLPVPYDFVNLAGDTKKMSASKGTGLSAEAIIRSLPPEVIRFFMLRYPPSKRLYFDPQNGVSLLIDDFAALLSKPNKTEADQQLIDVSTNGIEATVSPIPFSHLVSSYQAASRDKEQTLEILVRTAEYADAARKEAEVIKKQLDFIQGWLDSDWAPEDIKFSIEEEIDHLKDFSDQEKQFLRILSEKISQAPEDADGEWFHKAIYEVKETMNLQPQEVFKPLYRALINKESGPRAGWFLSDLNKNTQRGKTWLVNRFKLEK